MAASGVARGTSPSRHRYLDLLRVASICAVLLGHWLLTSISYSGGQLSGSDAMADISWSGWATLLLQVMPVFFLIGGYVNSQSWAEHHSLGATWAWWVRHRAVRLLRPTTVYVTVVVILITACRLAGAGSAELAQAGWAVAFQLWFLSVYLVLIALTPALHAAHRRWGLLVPAVFVLGAAAVDAGVLGASLPVIGYANYVLVWGSMHQWGFAWRDGTLTRSRWRPLALAAGGAALLAALLAWSPFPVDMIGMTGGAVGNTVPPSVALLAFAAAQSGLVLAAEPAASRLLASDRLWRVVSWLNDRVLTVYLWQMAPVIVVSVALYPWGVVPQPAIGSAGWWALRPAWIAVLALVLTPAAIWLARFELPLRRRPGADAGAAPPPAMLAPAWSSALSAVLIAAGIVVEVVAIARIAIDGFAPAGSVPAGTIAGYGCGVMLVFLAGRLAYRQPGQLKAAGRPEVHMASG
jgi:fucose 4-O-acetylase-like acetyltransferase